MFRVSATFTIRPLLVNSWFSVNSCFQKRNLECNYYLLFIIIHKRLPPHPPSPPPPVRKTNWYSSFIIHLKPIQFSLLDPNFRWKGILWFHHCQYVSMAIGKRVLSKTAPRVFLKLLMKLGCLKGKKLTEPDFWEKILFWG